MVLKPNLLSLSVLLVAGIGLTLAVMAYQGRHSEPPGVQAAPIAQGMRTVKPSAFFPTGHPTPQEIAVLKTRRDDLQAQWCYIVTNIGETVHLHNEQERLRSATWIRALIEGVDDPTKNLRVWCNTHQSKSGPSLHWNIALSDFSYLVALRDDGSTVLLLTAFPVEREKRRKKLERGYQCWCEEQTKKAKNG